MVVTNAMLSVVEITISFILGFLIYYIVSDQSRQQNKILIGKIISDLINFVLFIWLSKVILNLSLFVREPLTVLAYPGNADTFYLAFFFSAALFLYQSKIKKTDQSDYLIAFSMVFLITSLVYELIQLLWNNNAQSFGYILLLSTMLILFLIFENRLKIKFLIITLITMWSAGMLLLSRIYPVVTVFDYTIRPWFAVIFFIVSSIIIFFTVGKGDKK